MEPGAELDFLGRLSRGLVRVLVFGLLWPLASVLVLSNEETFAGSVLHGFLLLVLVFDGLNNVGLLGIIALTV